MINENIAAIRIEYNKFVLLEENASPNAITQFTTWFNEAIHANIEDANALTLATVDSAGNPHARIVLLKSVDEQGFVFFTNYNSHKGAQLDATQKCCMVFYWKELQRQVRIEGTVTKTSAAYSEAYFNSRPIESQIGACASEQSKEIESREALDIQFQDKLNTITQQPIQRPTHWGGYVVKPHNIEFWQGRENRMHDRLVYRLENEQWKIYRLQP